MLIQEHTTHHSPRARLLLAEDMEVVREVYANVLKGAGYEVALAHDGAEAWEMMRAGSFDLIVTDQTMPRLSGVELLRLVRDENRDIPALLVSGDLPLHEPDLIALVTPGGLLSKPFSRVELLDAVHAAMAGSALLKR